jgi:hypothetical protein
MNIEADRLMAMAKRLEGLKPVSDNPTFDEVIAANPDLTFEIECFRTCYDKYAEWPSQLSADGDMYNSALAAGILSINKIIERSNSAIVDGKILPSRWGSILDMSEEDMKYLDEKKADIIILFRRPDKSADLIPIIRKVRLD